MILTPERLGVLQQMKREAEAGLLTIGAAIWRVLKFQVDDPAAEYVDNGLRAALVWQVTGDAKYVTLAWPKILPWFTRKLSANDVREYFLEHVLIFLLLFDGLSQAQRDQYLAGLNRMATFATAKPVLGADSDQTTGTYFGLAVLYLTTKTFNPTAVQLWSLPWVGGVDVTGTNRETMRNAIATYVKSAAGGEWIESSEYNMGTVRLLIMGVEAVKNLTGEEHFPEVRAWFKEAALARLQFVHNSLTSRFQWGDCQTPRSLEVAAWATTAAMLSGVTQDDPDVGPLIQDHALTLLEGSPAAVLNHNTWPRAWYTFNPYAPRGSYRDAPTTHYASGQGLSFYRTGWDADDSAAMIHARGGQETVHHQVSYLGTFQLHRKGQFAITQPLGYDDLCAEGSGANAMMFGPFSGALEGRYVVAQETGEGFTYVAATTGGQVYSFSTYMPPPTFLHEWTRSIVYLPSTDKSCDTFVIFDRVYAEDPRKLKDFAQYRDAAPAHETLLKNADSIAQWYQHCQERPIAVSAEVSTWTAGAQQVVLEQVIGQPSTTEVQDLSVLWPASAVVAAKEKKWRLRIVPLEHEDYQTRLQVLTVSDLPWDGESVAIDNWDRAIDESERYVQGVRISRPGQDDVVLIFGAAEGEKLPPHLRVKSRPGQALSSDPKFESTLRAGRFAGAEGYTLSFTSNTDTTHVMAFDLPQGVAYGAGSNGKYRAPLTTSSAGVGRFTLTGKGEHQLTVGSPQEPPPGPPAELTLPERVDLLEHQMDEVFRILGNRK